MTPILSERPSRDYPRALLEQMVVNIPLSEIEGNQKSLGDPVALTRQLPAVETARMLSGLALALHFELHPDLVKAQRALANIIKPPRLRDSVLAALEGPTMRAWLHPHQILYGYHLLAEHGGPPATRDAPDTQLEEQFYRWLMMINDHVHAGDEHLVDRYAQSRDPLALIAWQSRSTGMTDIPQEVNLISRTYHMLTHCLEELRGRRGCFDLDAKVAEITGLSWRTILSGGFAIWTRFHELYESARKEMQLHPASVWPFQFLSTSKLSPQDVELLVAFFSCPLDDLPQRFVDTEHLAGAGPYNVLPLQENPLLALGNGEYICSWPRLFLESFTNGIYFRLRDWSQGEYQRPDNPFTSFWGDLFERYVSDQVEAAFAGVQPRPGLYFDNGRGNWPDAAIVFGRAAVFIEACAKRLTVGATATPDLTRLSSDLGKGVLEKAKQLDGYISRWPLPVQRRRISTIFPVIVTWLPFATGWPLWEWMKPRVVGDRLFRQKGARGVQIMDIEELESVLGAAAKYPDFSLVNALEQKASEAPEQSFSGYLRGFHVAPTDNRLIAKAWGELDRVLFDELFLTEGQQ